MKTNEIEIKLFSISNITGVKNVYIIMFFINFFTAAYCS